MQRNAEIVIALANPHIRTRVVAVLRTLGVAMHTPHNLEELTSYLVSEAEGEPWRRRVLLLDEAFIYPHVYEECSGIKAAAQVPLTVILLVEPRTRTRWDWSGVDQVLRLPMNVEEIADRAVGSLAAQNCRSYIQDETAP